MRSAERQTTIVIPTYGRAAALHQTVAGLVWQTALPEKTLICAGDERSVLRETRATAGAETGRTALVHLGVRSGRISGVRLGYSQIVNPVSFWRKPEEQGLGPLTVHFWQRLVVSNLAHSVVLSKRVREDRPGRLRGNLLAFGDLLRGRIELERILSL